MGKHVTGSAGQNTVHVRMSFDQDTQSWQVAQLQSSSADLLGAIKSQLQSMPDGQAKLETNQGRVPGTCQPTSAVAVNSAISCARNQPEAMTGDVHTQQRPGFLPVALFAACIDQHCCRRYAADGNPGNMLDCATYPLVPLPRLCRWNGELACTPTTDRQKVNSTYRPADLLKPGISGRSGQMYRCQVGINGSTMVPNT